EVLPAPSTAVTVFAPLSLAPLVHVYAWAYAAVVSSVADVGVKPPERPGKVTFATPLVASLVVAVTSNVPPAPPGRYKSVVPLTKLSALDSARTTDGVAGGVASYMKVKVELVSTLPATSVATTCTV